MNKIHIELSWDFPSIPNIFLESAENFPTFSIMMISHTEKFVIFFTEWWCWSYIVLFFVLHIVWVARTCWALFLVKGERFVFHHHGTYARWKTFSPFTKKVPTFSATQTFAAQKQHNATPTSPISEKNEELFFMTKS